jgi:hypothetical protein
MNAKRVFMLPPLTLSNRDAAPTARGGEGSSVEAMSRD